MIQQGPYFPTQVTGDASVGSIPWVNPDNITTEGLAYTYANVHGGNAVTNYAVATGFGFNVPDDAVNLSVLVEWKKKRQVSLEVGDAASRIVLVGVIQATDQSLPGFWPYTGFAWRGYEVTGLTPADVNDPGFGAAMAAKELAGDSIGTVYLDACRITVSYEGP